MAIVVALDEKSKRSERVVNFSIEESKLRNEKLIFIHSLFGGEKTTQEEIDKGEALLQWAGELARKAGVDYETKLLVRGKEPAEDIIEFADEIRASLIVIGVRKRRPAGKLLFGSVAQEVILYSSQPVICVK
ncbi:MAG: universal stress protein [Archaeoglobales archaeon]|jgi:nucleotide-binding universal stress UspA family protein|nr:universal stress protein [Archaeoglobales archaeon]TDA30858.1 MAG: universal stress protein [Archaeoglobi archaeon]